MELNEKDERRIVRLEENFETLSDSFSTISDWNEISKQVQSTTKLYDVNEIASFRNCDGLSTNSQIISSIESDRSGDIFATAGVLKQINLFNLDHILEEQEFNKQSRSRTYPILEIKCNAKISCLSWNPFYDGKLCSADYDGALKLHDTNESGKLCMTWTEHEKRCWSVDTSALDPQRLISGSDDCKVKLWSQKNQKSLMTLDIRANVCSVRFSPKDLNLIAVGAADHRVFLFDLRKPSIPIFNEKKHSKSVSYVKFADSGSSLISSSTDSTLRFWPSPGKSPSCSRKSERIYSGHLNEKNFVGLSINEADNLIATGSEDNNVVIYNQNLNYPVLKYPIMTACPLTGIPMEDEIGTFTSSVSWCNRADNSGNPILLAANSSGNIKVLSINEE